MKKIKRPSRRVLHIMSGYGGGISNFVHQLAIQAPKLGICFDVVVYDECSDDFVDIIKNTGGDVYQLKNPKKTSWKTFVNSFTRVLAIYKYDAVHCHIAGYRVMAYWPLIKKHCGQAAFYIHAHHQVDEGNLSIGQKIRHFIDQVINRQLTDSYIGCSRQAIWSLFGNVAYDEMVVFPNCINDKRLILDESTSAKLRQLGRKTYGLDQDDLVFGQIGRLEPVKNHKLTLDLASYMKENKLPGKILIVGSGSLYDQLEDEIKKRKLKNQVKLLGRVEPIETFMPVLDALIFPSKIEGLGTVAIEAQAAGIPVVMSSNLPREVDVDLGMVSRVALDSQIGLWYEELVRMSKIKIPSNQSRHTQLKSKKFTGDEAIHLYSQLISGSLISHHIY